MESENDKHPQAPWTTKEVDELINLYNAGGITYEQIAARMGRVRTSVQQQLVRVRQKQPGKLRQKSKTPGSGGAKRIRALCASGKSKAEIARETGYTASWIYKVIEQNQGREG